MKLICLLILTVCSFLQTGCTSYSSYENLPPTANVEVFRDGAIPSHKYRQVGTLGDNGKKSEQARIEGQMIKKAKGMGGNAIIFMPLQQNGAKSPGGIAGTDEIYSFKAIVVIYE